MKRDLGLEAECLGERGELFPRLGLQAHCWLGNISHAGRQQPHPGTANLMAGFQYCGQDARGWGGRLGRVERKQGNAREVRTLFLARRRLVLFPSPQLAAFFRKLDHSQKNEKFLSV